QSSEAHPLELRAQRLPILHIRFALRTLFFCQCRHQGIRVIIDRIPNKRPGLRRASGMRWKGAGEFDERLGSATLEEPPERLAASGTVPVEANIILHQSPEHQPILVALRLLAANEV